MNFGVPVSQRKGKIAPKVRLLQRNSECDSDKCMLNYQRPGNGRTITKINPGSLQIA